jgi:hypothetical protein
MSGKKHDRLHARTQIPHDQMADRWMDALGGEWEVKTLEGEVLHVAESYIKGRNWGLSHIPVGQDFSVAKKRV